MRRISAADRYLFQLHRILQPSDDPPSWSSASNEMVQEFWDTIAADRVRPDKSDWHGHGLTEMLVNLPKLRPWAKAALVKRVMDRWQRYVSDFRAGLADTDPVRQPAAVSVLTDQDHEEPLAAVQADGTNRIRAKKHAIVTRTIPHRRDWFKRLTDWVAAMVTLWKQP